MAFLQLYHRGHRIIYECGACGAALKTHPSTDRTVRLCDGPQTNSCINRDKKTIIPFFRSILCRTQAAYMVHATPVPPQTTFKSATRTFQNSFSSNLQQNTRMAAPKQATAITRSVCVALLAAALCSFGTVSAASRGTAVLRIRRYNHSQSRRHLHEC